MVEAGMVRIGEGSVEVVQEHSVLVDCEPQVRELIREFVQTAEPKRPPHEDIIFRFFMKAVQQPGYQLLLVRDPAGRPIGFSIMIMVDSIMDNDREVQVYASYVKKDVPHHDLVGVLNALAEVWGRMFGASYVVMDSSPKSYKRWAKARGFEPVSVTYERKINYDGQKQES